MNQYTAARNTEGGVIDQYTPVVGGVSAHSLSPNPLQSWVPLSDRRRLLAYTVLDQLVQRADPATPAQQEANYPAVRFGEAEYVAGVMSDLVLGGTQSLVVPGADAVGADVSIVKGQEAVREWAMRRDFAGRLQSAEFHAASLGDGVLRLRYATLLNGSPSVVVDVIDPATFFPTYNDNGELSAADIQWTERVETRPGYYEELLYRHSYFYLGGKPHESAAWFELPSLRLVREEQAPDGSPVRLRPIDAPAIPVYHVPNTSHPSNFGVSDVGAALDILYQLNHTRTDVAASASTAGSPPMLIKGLKRRIPRNESAAEESGALMTVGPNQVLPAEDARYVDNTSLLTVLHQQEDRLSRSLASQSRLGRLFSGLSDNLRDIESARAVKMLMAALYTKIDRRRAQRSAIYGRMTADLAYMLRRVGVLPEAAELRLVMGSVLPSDNAEDIELVTKLWDQGKGPMSPATAVRMLQRAGVPVQDEALEVENITARHAGQERLSNDGTRDPGAPGEA